MEEGLNHILSHVQEKEDWEAQEVSEQDPRMNILLLLQGEGKQLRWKT